VRSGDPRAFEVLFDRYADFIYNFAFRRTGSWDAAEEIVSMVFLEAWRQRLHVTTHDGSIRPWLIGVAFNLIRRHWRNAERRRRASLRLVGYEQVDADHAVAVSDRLWAEEQMRQILTALDDLPGDQREVVELWAWEELSYSEIAAVLEIPVGTVRSRLHRARERLQQHGTRRPHRASTGDNRPSAVTDCRAGEEGAQS
jgi:RNA polymerase sigma-70 factor (ECF subfamily)